VIQDLHIHGMGHFHPENVISNRFLEELEIGTTDAWIVDRVGIRTRRTVLPLDYIKTTKNADVRAGQEAAVYTNGETGKRAALMACARAGIQPKDIGMVIAGGSNPSWATPGDSSLVAEALGVDAIAIDMNSACSSFATQLHFLSTMTNLPPWVLVVSTENTTRAIDYRDRSAAVLWGDGTSAAIVSRESVGKFRVRKTTLASNPSAWRSVTIPRFSHFTQEGSAVQRFAIKTTLACLLDLLPAARERGGKLHFVGHQANLLMLESVVRRAELPAGEHWWNVNEFGNTGASGGPTVISQHWDELTPGETVLLVVVGAGLTWASLDLEVVR
jgi:3-oxoacyl-[acyl-carrier-protein] synthase-3